MKRVKIYLSSWNPPRLALHMTLPKTNNFRLMGLKASKDCKGVVDVVFWRCLILYEKIFCCFFMSNKLQYVTFSHWTHSWICQIEDWYFVTKIVLTYCEKKLFFWSRRTFEIQSWRSRICKNFEITGTIYSNSERSEQFLVTECFFNLFLEVSQISDKLEQLELKLEKIIVI